MTQGTTVAQFGRNKRGKVMPQAIIDQRKSQGIEVQTFPSDLGADGVGFVMNFVEYAFTDNSGSVPGASEVTRSIMLPLPISGITDKQAVKYNEGELGQIGGAAAGLAAGGGDIIGRITGKLNNPLEEGEVTAEDGAKALLGSLGAVSRQGFNELAAGVSEGIVSAANLAIGNVLNPHVALLFQTVNLKTFSMTWKLSPATIEESASLRNIINQIRMHSHPSGVAEGDATNFYLDFPDQVDLYYAGVGDYFHYFKRCAITDMEVNYQPEGGTVINAGTGAPTIVDLTIGFQETEIWTREDYEDENTEIVSGQRKKIAQPWGNAYGNRTSGDE